MRGRDGMDKLICKCGSKKFIEVASLVEVTKEGLYDTKETELHCMKCWRAYPKKGGVARDTV